MNNNVLKIYRSKTDSIEEIYYESGYISEFGVRVYILNDDGTGQFHSIELNEYDRIDF